MKGKESVESSETSCGQPAAVGVDAASYSITPAAMQAPPQRMNVAATQAQNHAARHGDRRRSEAAQEPNTILMRKASRQILNNHERPAIGNGSITLSRKLVKIFEEVDHISCGVDERSGDEPFEVLQRKRPKVLTLGKR